MEPHIIPKHESGRNAHTRHKGGDFPMPMDSSILAAARGKPEGRLRTKMEPMLVNPSRLPSTGSFNMEGVPRF